MRAIGILVIMSILSSCSSVNYSIAPDVLTCVHGRERANDDIAIRNAKLYMLETLTQTQLDEMEFVIDGKMDDYLIVKYFKKGNLNHNILGEVYVDIGTGCILEKSRN